MVIPYKIEACARLLEREGKIQKNEKKLHSCNYKNGRIFYIFGNYASLW